MHAPSPQHTPEKLNEEASALEEEKGKKAVSVPAPCMAGETGYVNNV